MKKYKVEWLGAKNKPMITRVFEVEDEDVAFAKAVETYKCPAYPRMYVNWNWGIGQKCFDNPHFDPNYVEPEKADVEKVKESRTEQPAGTDGSVGWYDNLGEGDLSDRDILLAQLHELRTIKRCVVCTILIVIVIPIVFGVTR